MSGMLAVKTRWRPLVVAVLLLSGLLAASPATSGAAAAEGRAGGEVAHYSLANHRWRWPSREHVWRVLSLRDYNTRVVLLGTSLLGVSAGAVGVFMLLRKRSLVGDVISHASLPGIAVAFLIMERWQAGSGKTLGGLLIGALSAGVLGVLCTSAIRRYTRIKEDAALAIVLSIFFGVGISLFTVIQNIPTGNAAGLNEFIFGKAASMIADDVRLIGQAALVVLIVCGLLFKEFSLLAFDEKFAAAQGWPVAWLDLILMGLVVGVTVIGLQCVGLLLVVAMLIIPAAAARFWTDHLRWMMLVSAFLGGLSACLGVLASALIPRLAAGAIIVLVGSCCFIVSLLFGIRRGVVRRLWLQRQLRAKVGRHHVLRAFYEHLEPWLSVEPLGRQKDLTSHTVSFEQLLAMRSWNRRRLRHLLKVAQRAGLVRSDLPAGYRLTPQGAADARRVARNHRLWELYLIHYADIATSHVDRDADQIEHVLEPALLQELEALLTRQFPAMSMPRSPHAIPVAALPSPLAEDAEASGAAARLTAGGKRSEGA